MRLAFNNFVLDCEQRVLWAQGQVVPLSPKVFDTLRLLVLADGRIVTKQEFMVALWPDSFVEDGNLTQNIFVLRKVLGTSADGRPYIETVPRRGYRFMGTVQSEESAVAPEPPGAGHDLPAANPSSPDPLHDADALSFPAPPDLQPATVPSRRNVLFVLSFFMLAASIFAGLFAVWRWRVEPRVGEVTRLTNDDGTKDLRITPGTLITDGSNLYFNEVKDNQALLAEVSIKGGETSYSVLPSPNAHLVGIDAGDRSLLFGSKWPSMSVQPLLSRDLSTGVVTHLFGIDAQDASWSSDGSKLAFAQAGKLFARGADGSTRLLASVEGTVYWPRWSPDGQTVRFSENYEGFHDRLWEVDSDGGHQTQLFADQIDRNNVCCGSWTRSGKSFVYLSIQLNNNSIRVRPAYASAWNPFTPGAIDIPAAPLDKWISPVPALDGKHILAVGEQLHGRLVRIDPLTRRPEPFIGGISAEGVSFSPDHTEIVWTAYPEGTLWRSHSDGTGRTQLTQMPLIARFPRWSPDGSTIVFLAARPGTDWQLYSVSAKGGEISAVLQESSGQGAPTWSPDGKFLAFGHLLDMAETQPHPFGIEILRLSDKKTTLVPGSTGMWTARWSPDGRFLSAVTTDDKTLRIYDLEKAMWTDLAHGSVNDVVWSPDSKFLFFDTDLGTGPVIFRVRISDGKLETYATLDNFRRTGFFAPWLGVAADGSPILLEDSSIQEIYSVAVNLR